MLSQFIRPSMRLPVDSLVLIRLLPALQVQAQASLAAGLAMAHKLLDIAFPLASPMGGLAGP